MTRWFALACVGLALLAAFVIREWVRPTQTVIVSDPPYIEMPNAYNPRTGTYGYLRQ